MMKTDMAAPSPISKDKAAMWSILALALMIQFGLGQAVQALASSVDLWTLWAAMAAVAAFLVGVAYRRSMVLDEVFAWRGTSVGWLALSAGVGGMMSVFVRAQFDSLRPVGPETIVISTTVGPVIEELLYRGFLWGVLGDVVGPIRSRVAFVIVACCSATLFALAHMNPSVGYFWLRFSAGLANGFLRGGSGSSLPPSIAHLAFNICMVS